MRIVLIADTHERHRALNGFMPEGDLLIHAGDFTMLGEPLYVKEFNKWLGEQPYKYKVVIPGNHELSFDEVKNLYYLEARALITNATLLVNSSCIVEGLKIYGMPDTPWFHNWAFNFRDMSNSVAAIPNDIDILVSHGPPFGICDQTRPDRESLGCRELRGRLDSELSPKLCVFGHIHGGYGVHKDWTTFVNASICDEAYRPVNKPVVIEL